MEIRNQDYVKAPSLKKYDYDISEDFSFSCKIGKLYPVTIVDAIPGDSINHRIEHFGRLAPLVHPMMQEVQVNFHRFFVPYRLIYPDLYDKVLTEPNPESHIAFPMLRFKMQDVFDSANDYVIRENHKALCTLCEFLGAPIKTWQFEYKNTRLSATSYKDIALAPVIGYLLIWNEYFRDSLKQDPISFDLLNFSNRAISTTSFLNAVKWNPIVQNANYPRDYFNTSQYTPQLGDSVNLPLSGEVRSSFTTPSNGNAVANAFIRVKSKSSTATDGQQDLNLQYVTDGDTTVLKGDVNIRSLLSLDTLNINTLKELFALQHWADIGNMFGKRYIEQVLGHFGVHSSDARLQRPDYLGSSTAPIQISEVTQLSETSSSSPLGEMAGRGISYGGSYNKELFCEEHGFYMVLMSVMPKQAYMNGCPRYLLKSQTFDFAFPEFANIGEQEVFEREIYDGANADGVFGYQERYAEYKRSYNRVAGEFANTLKAFTMAIDLSNAVDEQGRPVENVTINQILYPHQNDIDRAFAVVDSDHLYLTIHNDTKRSSVLPYVSRTVSNIL